MAVFIEPLLYMMIAHAICTLEDRAIKASEAEALAL